MSFGRLVIAAMLFAKFHAGVLAQVTVGFLAASTQTADKTRLKSLVSIIVMRIAELVWD